MRAAYITELGPADAIRVGELPTPVPGPTDVLVRVELVVVDPVASVAVLHPAATAHLAPFRHGGLRPGETIYIGGAAGNVGGAATSLARLGGARVLAGARAEDAATCTSTPPATWTCPPRSTCWPCAAATINAQLTAGALPARVHDVWPLDRAAEAHQAVERRLRGRIILRVGPAGA